MQSVSDFVQKMHDLDDAALLPDRVSPLGVCKLLRKVHSIDYGEDLRAGALSVVLERLGQQAEAKWFVPEDMREEPLVDDEGLMGLQAIELHRVTEAHLVE